MHYAPVPLRTDLLMKFLNTEEKKQRRLVHIPWGRFGKLRKWRQQPYSWVSDRSSYMTGTEFWWMEVLPPPT